MLKDFFSLAFLAARFELGADPGVQGPAQAGPGVPPGPGPGGQGPPPPPPAPAAPPGQGVHAQQPPPAAPPGRGDQGPAPHQPLQRRPEVQAPVQGTQVPVPSQWRIVLQEMIGDDSSEEDDTPSRDDPTFRVHCRIPPQPRWTSPRKKKNA